MAAYAIQKVKLWLLNSADRATESGLALLRPLLRRLCRNGYRRGSVLHISVMVHTAYQAAFMLRAHGVHAKYLAVGESPIWNKSDYTLKRSRWPFVNRWREFHMFWTIIRKFEIVHSHFMEMPSSSLWEIHELKAMGRKFVVHFRGCEARDRERNMALHPLSNICQECEQKNPICQQAITIHRRKVVMDAADTLLVTTPDMLDFVKGAEYVPFFSPMEDSDLYLLPEKTEPRPQQPFKIVHVTVHPGIEGTRHIQAAVTRLRQRGYNLQFVYLNWVPQEVIRRELKTADLAIGKMKMGYYANSQIESMMMGVPTVTYVREEFLTPELEESGFIFATL